MPAGVVKVEPWKRLTPVFQHADKRPGRNVGLDSRLGQTREADARQSGIAKKAGVIDDKRSLHIDLHHFARPSESPYASGEVMLTRRGHSIRAASGMAADL